ncbi:PRC-barrel domain-containing protein [Halomonas daqingensis]|uniref:PRC-barrel domain-containing protein n=1 Tax=Billgrantia desiderata TaxID=52021 RepID=A0AAW4YQA1_9GAMM|nr:PRC-barrel domain-containing protein [Halomonas desiderata]MCE8013081.1 PRC-barrel domain-containing protein [Halomonas desiderata]MCE8030110.1 PRC-barrel domain-containing protein [Halomonas desiderata]MCE8042614.1 PRC-barrel domain-containing protein [Halomonas desiderata]MCE8047189.1 PRC-barrel domain-containing protein [Halomonas desiderata]MCE8050510.1 PRC-barrel domain-containing protein [Halomonas desiderata]
MQKRALTIAVAAIAGGLAFGTQAVAQDDPQAAQGLYSANDIIGADVYHADDPDEEVGNVENILLDDDGQVSALVVNAGGLWGMGGDDVVVGIEHFTMETERNDDGIFDQDGVTHRILVDATEDELENFPEYDEQWFGDEQDRRTQERGDQEGVWQTTGTTGTGAVGDDGGTAFRDGEADGDTVGATDGVNDNGDDDAEYTDEDVVDDFD